MGLATSSHSSNNANTNSECDHLSRLVSGQRVVLNSRAKKLLPSLSLSTLWENFLCSANSSFAVTPAEAKALLVSSLTQPTDVSGAIADDYLKQVIELSSSGLAAGAASSSGSLSHSKAVPTLDMMSIISATLLLSDLNLEEKIDRLFLFVALDESADSFSFQVHFFHA